MQRGIIFQPQSEMESQTPNVLAPYLLATVCAERSRGGGRIIRFLLSDSVKSTRILEWFGCYVKVRLSDRKDGEGAG